MELVKKSYVKWTIASVILTLGIVSIIGGAAYQSNNLDKIVNAMTGTGIAFGIVLILAGGLFLGLSVYNGIKGKVSFGMTAIIGGVIIAIGISIIVDQYIITLMGLVVQIIPYLLIVLGGIILADSILSLIRAAKEKQNLTSIIMLALAVVAIIIGALSIGGNPLIPQTAQLIILGILLVLAAIYIVVTTFIKMPKLSIVVQSKGDTPKDEPQDEAPIEEERENQSEE